jgi:hypothetical protein
MGVLGIRLNELLAHDADSVDELCRQHPAQMGDLAKVLAEQAEAAVHKQLELPKTSKDHKQQELLLTQFILGLVKLLCCSSQQVHCAVVSHMARLAYCTPVLEQATFALNKYPAAIASVVNLLRGHVQAPDPISKGGPPPTLQAEAAAALLVLSSLGKGSKQLVGHHPDAITGLAEAIISPPADNYWTAPTPGASTSAPEMAAATSSQQRQQPHMPRSRSAAQ